MQVFFDIGKYPVCAKCGGILGKNCYAERYSNTTFCDDCFRYVIIDEPSSNIDLLSAEGDELIKLFFMVSNCKSYIVAKYDNLIYTIEEKAGVFNFSRLDNFDFIGEVIQAYFEDNIDFNSNEFTIYTKKVFKKKFNKCKFFTPGQWIDKLLREELPRGKL